ncbi:MAG TPA: OmpH family outer membrane protein [Ignavibacteria bacterium]|nr:OmpH family outer membrane protein [Ignavibacteria bacterium]HMR40965.1 OmpH family outer membrane protein [Ignavibacteria bacterium]
MIIPNKSLSIILFSFIVILTANSVMSQTKVGYIDSKKIIDGMQDSRDAKARLDNQVTEWQTELKVLEDSLQNMKDDFEKKKLILTDQLKEQTETQIKNLETRVMNFRTEKFGENGEYFQKQTEFMKPVLDKVFKAIEIVAKDGNYDYVFDRSSEIMLLYVNENYDLTLKVINTLEGK